MKTLILSALAAASLALGTSGLAQAQSRDEPYAQFDVRNARTWAEKLVLCDTTAFLASRPDFGANRMWVFRDDGRRDLLLGPDFVGAGRWYKEGYEQLYWRLRREKQITSEEMLGVQNSLGRSFVETYRRLNGYGPGSFGGAQRFLDRQDSSCRKMARQEGVIII